MAQNIPLLSLEAGQFPSSANISGDDGVSPKYKARSTSQYGIKRKPLPPRPYLELQSTDVPLSEVEELKILPTDKAGSKFCSSTKQIWKGLRSGWRKVHHGSYAIIIHPFYQLVTTANFRRLAKHSWEGLLPGWRKGIAWNSLYTAIVLLINVLWLVITVSTAKSSQGIYTLYEGSCSRASTIDSVLHVIINILSTVLLGSSNYAVQCLTSPTRTEVDRAHREKKWLYVGIPNFKNLLWISRSRRLLVLLLIISAWPLHLIWNSMVFNTLQSNQYGVLVVSPEFLNSGNFDPNLGNINQTSWEWSNYYTNVPEFLALAQSLHNKTKDSGSMVRLDNSECIKTYFQPLLTDRRNLLLITNSSRPTNATPSPDDVQALAYWSPQNGSMLNFMDSRSWLQEFVEAESFWKPAAFACAYRNFNDFNDHCSLGEVSKHADDWTAMNSAIFPGNVDSPSYYFSRNEVEYSPSYYFSQYKVEYCLSEIADERCQVQLLLPLMALVIICNVVKLICLVLTVFTVREPPLVTLGDALASYLARMDDGPLSETKEPTVVIDKVRHWGRTARSDLIMTILLSSATLIVAGILLHIGIVALSLSGQNLGSTGFGQVSGSALIRIFIGGRDTSNSVGILTGNILIVNLPQLVFTLLYPLYNRACTKMLAMHEWTKFAFKRRTLRVSQPSDIQRSTYWLHLPYRYSITLLTASSLMHFFISRSLFLVRIGFYDKYGQPDELIDDSTDDQTASNFITVPGYSPQAIVAAIALGGIMVLALCFLSFRKFASPMPLIGNKSSTIAAACRCPADDERAAEKRLKWGAVSHPEGDQPGRCYLTSFSVEPPIIGGLYI